MTWAEPRQLALIPDPLHVRFVEFHHANPGVYWALVRLAKQWHDSGHESCSIKMLVEVLRWNQGVSTDSAEPWAINNSYAAYYSRLIAANEPDLAHLFTFRQQQTDYLETA